MASTKSLLHKARTAILEGDKSTAISALVDFMDRTSRYDDQWWQAAFDAIRLASEVDNCHMNLQVLTCIAEAVEVTKRLIPTDLQLDLYTSLAASHAMANHEDFIRYLEKALVTYESMEDANRDFRAMQKVAVLCLRAGAAAGFLDRAEGIVLEYLPKSKYESSKRQHRRLMAVDLLAQIYSAQGNTLKSTSVRRECIEEAVAEFQDQADYQPSELPSIPLWGKDVFTNFLANAHHNTVASVITLDGIFDGLSSLHARYSVTTSWGRLHLSSLITATSGDVNLQSFTLPHEDALEVFFFMRTHSCLLAAARLGLAGQIAESYGAIRNALEHALYAFRIARNADLKRVWLDRHVNGTESRDATIRQFRPGRICNALSQEYPELGQLIHDLYELTIDEGAHPNANTFFKHFVQRNEPGAFAVGVHYLDTDYILPCVKHIVEAGNACLELFRILYPSWVW